MNYPSYVLASWLCIILGYAGCVSQATTITADLATLNDYFNASVSDIADGSRPLFTNMMKRWKEDSDKRILMSHIITVYFKIFEILKDNSVIKNSLEKIKEDMIIKFFPNNTFNRAKDIEDLLHTQVNDFKVQRKAIFELDEIMQDLSSKSHLRKRKRRQNRSQRTIKQ
ncbi:interferon gamma [Gracilinanus agilis]|uniref:interferon gamma n=1 Tax=Gracilinanus agilis TaxID=191870 RepID=UPI001CFD7CAE|nr:interferon gamma [Gracilinanus agilis]